MFFLQLALINFVVVTVAFKQYQDRIPNGKIVPHPCKPNHLWKGVGHLIAGGGGRRNPFGVAFEASGKRWTTELCRVDSDGDGKTNGEELGDPNCTWQLGQLPEKVKGITHPGICDPFDSPVCRAKNTWVNCDSEKFNCPAIEEKEVLTMDVRMPNVSIPLDATYYLCTVVDVPTDRDYHVIAVSPIIDNEYVIHHSVVSGCASETGGRKFDKQPAECGMSGTDGECEQLVGIWTLGSSGHCFHDQTGITIGKNGLKRIVLQNHYTNPEHYNHWYDTSGVRVYYTPTLRKYELGTWSIGQMSIEIPPGQSNVEVTGRCESKCTKDMNQTLYIVDSLMHAHYLATGITVQHSHKGAKYENLVNEVPYSYDNPIFHTVKAPIEFRPGDEFTIKCSYQSLSRKTHTSWGLGTYDEMCYGFFFYYPKIKNPPLCVPFKDVNACDGGQYRGCKNLEFSTANSTLALQEHVLESCGSGQCNQRCALALHRARLQPCLQGQNLLYRIFISQFRDKKDQQFYSLFKKMSHCRIHQLAHVRPVVG